ncbi:hypothetical protein SHL15_7719 [Streptomyces hygroscopicus subsp. limoneus]|nr:hypothetical protein SHL15_7719 [Streptomyces hygroscopicus subsp. limoneus]
MHETFVGQFDTDQRYDVIVSGLPLTNFTPVQVERIMARYMDLLHPGGTSPTSPTSAPAGHAP